MANNGKIINGRLVLKTISLVATAIGFGAQVLNTWASKKEEELQMREIVQKEINRQLAIPMKVTEKRDP
ncbi:MAG: hypothetical protein J6U54_07990 [Clostridiales bacterium]|nr:hypothetical protein [Clostridiales bacterium]